MKANLKRNVQIKGKQIAITSILSNNEEKAKGKYKTEQDLVIGLMRDMIPRTSRQIAKALDKERTNITRTLYDLCKDGKVVIAKVAPCPTSKKQVRWYSLKSKCNEQSAVTEI